MTTTGNLRPLYICGSTATGKTSVSIELSKLVDGEIVNADAYQVYAGIDTITAAPSPNELTQVPHHLFGILSPEQEFDAQKYIDLAKPIITEIQSRNKIPIIVGGSGMYLKFLTHGPSNLPSGDPELRKKLELLTDEDLIDQLAQLDPKGSNETNLKNRRYVIRALEICLLSGKPMSLLKTDWSHNNIAIEKNLRGAYLSWDREILRDRIKQRTRLMLEASAIDEITKIAKFSDTCIKAIGIRDVLAYLNEEISIARLGELIFFATCQYAKRQNTWFNRESWLHEVPMNCEADPKKIASQIAEQLV